MEYKFNPYERAVGLFLSVFFSGSLIFGFVVAVKKNWFEDKINYETQTTSASNIREGNSVEMSGLKIGKIESVDMTDDFKIKVTFSIHKKYQKMMRNGIKVHFIRSFILGDKILSLSQASQKAEILAQGSFIPSEESADLMDLLAGDKVQPLLSKLEATLNNLNDTIEIGKNIAGQMGDNKQLKVTLDNMAFASRELRKFIPLFSNHAPEMTKDVALIVKNLTVLTTAFREMQPLMSEMSKSLPEGSKKAMEALHESVIVLRAMQKSFFLKNAVEEANKEKAKRDQSSGIK